MPHCSTLAPGGWVRPQALAADLGLSLRTIYRWLGTGRYRVRREGTEHRPLYFIALDDEGFPVQAK